MLSARPIWNLYRFKLPIRTLYSLPEFILTVSFFIVLIGNKIPQVLNIRGYVVQRHFQQYFSCVVWTYITWKWWTFNYYVYFIITVNTYLFKYVPVKLGFIILSIIGVLRILEEFYLYKDKKTKDAVNFIGGGNHRSVASLWKLLLHNVVSRFDTHNVSGDM